MQYILLDTTLHNHFLPLSYTRSLADIRVGILTIKQKWEHYTGKTPLIKTKKYLQKKYGGISISEANDVILINSAILPDNTLVEEITKLNRQESLYKDGLWLASYTTGKPEIPEISIKKEYLFEITILHNLWNIFQYNDTELKKDYHLLTNSKYSLNLSKTNTLITDGKYNVFIEEGAKIEACTLNTLNGPIYIGKNAEVMEGSLLRGPISVGENAQIKMGAKIYGATTIGPGCKVGGEINNSVFFSNSNKAHDGFIGNSVIGEWCNLGADTNNSNLKNNYSLVKIWNEFTATYIDTKLQFCGVFLADFARTGINTMLNTGTVAGVFANIFGGDFPPKNIPCFAWGGASGFETFDFEKACQLAEKVMARRNQLFSDIDKQIYKHIYTITRK